MQFSFSNYSARVTEIDRQHCNATLKKKLKKHLKSYFLTNILALVYLEQRVFVDFYIVID